MTGLEIRSAAPAEHPAVAALTSAAFTAGPYGPSTDPARLAFERDAAGRAAAGDLIVAVDGDRLVGTASLLRPGTPHARQARPDELELRLLAVDPAARGRGVGEALTREALARARARGAAALVLDTGRENQAAHRLYDRLGFARVAARETFAPSPRIGTLRVYRYGFGGPAVRVRLVRADEHARVAALSVAAYEHDYPISEAYRVSLADVTTRAALHEVWVAVDATTDALLGTVTTPRPGETLSELPLPDELDFRLLAVAPAARGRGVGALLVRHVVGLARARGRLRVVMNSGDRMLGAHRLYHRMGFVRLPGRETRVVEGGVLLAFGLDVDQMVVPADRGEGGDTGARSGARSAATTRAGGAHP